MWGQFHKIYLNYQSLKLACNLPIWIFHSNIPGVNDAWINIFLCPDLAGIIDQFSLNIIVTSYRWLHYISTSEEYQGAPWAAATPWARPVCDDPGRQPSGCWWHDHQSTTWGRELPRTAWGYYHSNAGQTATWQRNRPPVRANTTSET